MYTKNIKWYDKHVEIITQDIKQTISKYSVCKMTVSW